MWPKLNYSYSITFTFFRAIHWSRPSQQTFNNWAPCQLANGFTQSKAAPATILAFSYFVLPFKSASHCNFARMSMWPPAAFGDLIHLVDWFRSSWDGWTEGLTGTDRSPVVMGPIESSHVVGRWRGASLMPGILKDCSSEESFNRTTLENRHGSSGPDGLLYSNFYVIKLLCSCCCCPFYFLQLCGCKFWCLLI